MALPLRLPMPDPKRAIVAQLTDTAQLITISTVGQPRLFARRAPLSFVPAAKFLGRHQISQCRRQAFGPLDGVKTGQI